MGLSREELRRILVRFDVADLTDQAYELYLGGIEDIEQLFFELEDTEIFRAAFPGIRDSETGEAITNVAGFVEFKRGLQSLLNTYGVEAGVSINALAGALIQQRRKLEEVATDLAAFDELRNNPFVRQQFYAYSGIDPGDEGLFALALGLPQAADLQRSYEQAIAAGVSVEEFTTRLRESVFEVDEPARERGLREELGFGLDRLRAISRPTWQAAGATTEQELDRLANERFQSAFDALAPERQLALIRQALAGEGQGFTTPVGISAAQRMRALRQAIEANRAQFMTTGRVGFERRPESF